MIRCFISRLSIASVCACLTIAAFAEPTAQVPKPYTPVEASPNKFGCLGRSTELGAFLLPEQIIAVDKPLLAAPAHLTAEPNVFAGLNGKPRLVKQTADSATWNWDADSADLHVHAVMTGDCDGFCWYEIHLEPKHPLTIRMLALEIPRSMATAKYIDAAGYNWAAVSRALSVLGGKWSGEFRPYVWLGDENRGLAWTAQSTEGWQLKDPGHALNVSTAGKSVLFSTHFIDHETTLTKSLVLTFGLQATPVKPISFAWRANFRVVHDIHYESDVPGKDGRCELDDIRDGGAKAVVFHDTWSSYYGQVTPVDKARMDHLIEACHARGLKLLVYIGYGLARSAPEIKGHHDNWSVMPLIPWTTAYNPSHREFDADCANSGWADWLANGIDKLFAGYKLDGLYFDGTTEAWACRNTEHGCGWKDASGNIQPFYPVLATRHLMRRIADSVHQHDPDAILDVHMSDNMTMPTLSFCDSAWNGEQFEGYTAAQKFMVPLDAFRSQFMGYAHGIDTEFLCYENRPFSFNEAITLAWVHGVEVRPYPKTLKYVTPIWRAMDRFGVSDAAWHPYWSDALASADNQDTKISGWTHADKALLFVSHLQRSPATVHVQLNLQSLHLGTTGLHATDAITNQPIPIDGDSLSLSFDGMSYKMVQIGR